MKYYRQLTVEVTSLKQLKLILKQIKKLALTNWTLQENFRDEYSEENGLDKDNLIALMSTYYKSTKPKVSKEVFAGIVYFGISNNKLTIFDIISVIKGGRLPVLQYNLILSQFIKEVVKPHPKIFKNTFGKIEAVKTKQTLTDYTPERQQRPKKSMVVSANPENFKIFNERLKRPVHYLSGNGEGKALMQEGDDIRIGNKDILYFTPNNISILLSIGNKAQINAKKLLKEIKMREEISDPLANIIACSETICDYIEQIQTCLVFTYTSIEAFVNLSIPENYQYTEVKKEAGVYFEKKYARDSIERLIPLKEKIKHILPDIYETEPIEGEKFFQKFNRLEEFRNKIIHQKSIEHTDLYKDYFNDSIFDVCKVANELITFFYDNCEDDFTTNPIWPTIPGKENVFPRAKFESKNFEIVTNIHKA